MRQETSKHRAETLWRLWDSGFKAALDFAIRYFFELNRVVCFSCVRKESIWRIMQIPPARRLLAVYLTLFGYLGDVYAGTVLMNSNAIKNLPGASGAKGADTVSPSPRTSPSGSMGHRSPADTLQVIKFPVRKSRACAPRHDMRLCEFCT